MSAPPRFTDVKSLARRLRRPAGGLVAALLLWGAAASAAGQERELPRLPKPVRVYTIQGQVSLPEGMPAGQTVVTLVSRSGVPRHIYTTEQGRFEFQDIPEGGYVLSAKSMADSKLSADGVEVDTTRTATGDLTVNLVLRRDISAHAAPKRAEAVSVAEVEQKVP